MVLPPRGLTDQILGCCQVEQPLLSKVVIRPAVMVRSPSATAAAVPFAKNTPQTHAYPAVEFRVCRAVGVFEILKPASQRAVDIGYDHGQAAAVRSSCLRPNRVLELLQTLLTRETTAFHESIAQEVKTLGFGVHDLGFCRMQRQALTGRPQSRTDSNARSASSRLRHWITRSSAYLVISYPWAAI